MTGYRLARNPTMERWRFGKAEPFRPLFDVEEIDDNRLPVRVIASGVDAETARAVIADAGGIEEPS
jgi:hypothetical protein